MAQAFRASAALSSKHQNPSSREAPNFKLQGKSPAICLDVGAWNFSGAWMLEFEFFLFVPHNWRVFKPAGILFCSALVFLAGCATTPDEPLPPDWSATSEVPKTQTPPVWQPLPA